MTERRSGWLLGATLTLASLLSITGLTQASERPTNDELAIFSHTVARDVIPWLERQSVYAGTWLDREAGQLVVSLTAAGPAVVAGLDARVPGGSDGWRLEVPRYTWKQLRRAMMAAWKVRSGLPGAGQLESNWIDAEENRIGLRFKRGAIKYRDVPAAENAWREELGVPVDIWREEITPSEPMAGKWMKLPDAPWAAAHAVAVAVDGDMLVLERETGRVLRYDPDQRAWERRAKTPRRFEYWSPWVWTGSELVVLDSRRPPRVYAYDAARDRWRTLPPSPLRGAGLAVWADGRVIVADVETESEVDIERSLAMLDLASGEWSGLPAPDAPTQLVGLHWTGTTLLAVTSDEGQDLVQVAALDLEDGSWSRPITGPVSWWYRHGTWIGDRLVFSGDGEYGPSDASFDPATMAWTAEDYDCPLDTREAIWTGELLVSESSRYLLDPATGKCYRFPGGARTMNSNAVVWTGDRVIYWSGGGAEEGQPDPYRHHGHAFVFERSD